MKKFLVFMSALLVAAACAAPPANREVAPDTNRNANTGETTSVAMTEAVAITTEKSIWDKIKEKDYEGFANMLAGDQIEVRPDGVADKAGSVEGVKQFEPSEVTFSDWKFLPIDKDAFIVIYTVSFKGKFQGKEFPQETVRASSAWVNRDNKWLAIYHQECPLKKPTPPPASSSAKAISSPAASPMMATTGPDPIANEKIVWDLFKSKNYDAFAELLAPDFLEVAPDNVYDKAGTVKGVAQFNASKAVTSDFRSVKFDEDAALVTYVVKDPAFAPKGERHTTIWANRNGKWLGLFHHASTPVLPSPSPAPKPSASPATK